MLIEKDHEGYLTFVASHTDLLHSLPEGIMSI